MITVIKLMIVLISVVLINSSCSTRIQQSERMDHAATQVSDVDYDHPPQIVNRVNPEYPVRMRQAGIQGTVIMEVEVLKDGSVGSVEVINSVLPGVGGIDEAAMEAVRWWKFTPARSAGEPVAVKIRIPRF